MCMWRVCVCVCGIYVYVVCVCVCDVIFFVFIQTMTVFKVITSMIQNSARKIDILDHMG